MRPVPLVRNERNVVSLKAAMSDSEHKDLCLWDLPILTASLLTDFASQRKNCCSKCRPISDGGKKNLTPVYLTVSTFDDSVIPFLHYKAKRIRAL